MKVAAVIVINAIVNPWLLIPATIMTILLFILRVVYINTGRSIKRIEATSEFDSIIVTNNPHCIRYRMETDLPI